VGGARTIGNILDDLQLLATRFPEVTTRRTKEQLAKAIEEVTKMEPCLPNSFEQMPSNQNSGSGQMYGSDNVYIGNSHIGMPKP
jgi:hypothetical protein